MITLHVLQYLQEAGFGTLETDLFWEKLPLDKNGVAAISRGGPLFRGRNKAVQAFDLYSRGSNDLLGSDKLEKIWELFVEQHPVCDLPIVPQKSNKLYTNVRISPVTNIENLGLDETDRIIFRTSYEAVYNRVTG